MLTDTEIEHIAKLARIELSDEMRSRMKHDLSEVLDYIALLEKADTAGVEPLYQVTGLQNQTRADERRGDLPVGRQVLVPDEKLTEYLVGQAPHSQGRLIKVKSVKSKA
ncbi:MAG: Asp-tRNA(Asn)/Glu-tRNA(Gln) amidotransferase subunit GatC [Patescibacteria group bacterium]